MIPKSSRCTVQWQHLIPGLYYQWSPSAQDHQNPVNFCFSLFYTQVRGLELYLWPQNNTCQKHIFLPKRTKCRAFTKYFQIFFRGCYPWSHRRERATLIPHHFPSQVSSSCFLTPNIFDAPRHCSHTYKMTAIFYMVPRKNGQMVTVSQKGATVYCCP